MTAHEEPATFVPSRSTPAERRVHREHRRAPLRAGWRDLKRRAALEVRTIDRDVAHALMGVLRSRLGPLVQRLEREQARFPDHDVARLEHLGGRFDRVLAIQRRQVSELVVDEMPSTAAWLLGELDGFAAEVRRRRAWYVDQARAADARIEGRLDDPEP